MSSGAELSRGPRRILALQTVRFVIVGGGTAVLLMALAWALLAAGAPPFASGLCAYGATIVVAYLLQRRWTFRASAGHRRTLPRYLLVQAGCALASGGLSHLLAIELGWPAALASAVMTACVAAFSYFASSLWVFRHA